MEQYLLQKGQQLIQYVKIYENDIRQTVITVKNPSNLSYNRYHSINKIPNHNDETHK